MAWLDAILAFFGIVKNTTDIVKNSQENARRTKDENQGAQNANAKSTADALGAVVNADRAADSPAVIERVRDEFERP